MLCIVVRSWEFLTPPPIASIRPLPADTKQWKQQQQFSERLKSPTSPRKEFGFDPRKMLRRRSSLVIADLPFPLTPSSPLAEYAANKATGGKIGQATADERSEDREIAIERPQGADKLAGIDEKASAKEQTLFKEPDPNSLLDAFGF